MPLRNQVKLCFKGQGEAQHSLFIAALNSLVGFLSLNSRLPCGVLPPKILKFFFKNIFILKN